MSKPIKLGRPLAGETREPTSVIATHVTRPQRAWLKDEAWKRRVSVNQLVRDLIDAESARAE